MNKTFIVSLIIGVSFTCLMILVGIIIDESISREPTYTTSYKNINVSQAKQLMSESKLTIIDCRPGCGSCQFNKGHIPGAQLSTKPNAFVNWTDDILAYCNDGSYGEKFCEQLVNHTYGKIYNLEGGWNAWRLWDG